MFYVPVTVTHIILYTSSKLCNMWLLSIRLKLIYWWRNYKFGCGKPYRQKPYCTVYIAIASRHMYTVLLINCWLFRFEKPQAVLWMKKAAIIEFLLGQLAVSSPCDGRRVKQRVNKLNKVTTMFTSIISIKTIWAGRNAFIIRSN